ncbi:MAG TPA: GAF and ANTAR domain-containing protein [Acidimicrobiia bacterium]|nr:GAF and ANTAR domain-containing protein [Acidimicrobiia bacterium]
MPVDPDALDNVLAGLRGIDDPDLGVQVVLQRVVDAAQHLFALKGAGLMFVDDGQALRYVAASDEPGRILEIAQEERGVGPCVDALVHEVVVTTRDIATDDRYEAIAAIVVREGVRSVMGMPVRLGGTTIGSLNVYADQPTDWDDTDIAAIGALAEVIEAIIGAAVLTHRQGNVVEQLEFALQNRVAIERAVGAIMNRDRVGPVEAFNVLRTEARSQRRKVADVAAEVLLAVVDGR